MISATGSCVHDRHLKREGFSEQQARDYMRQLLPTLDYWKRYDELSDGGAFEPFKQKLIEEINWAGERQSGACAL